MKVCAEDRNIIKRVINLFRPYKKKVFFILVCMLVSAGISMIIPKISQLLMDKGLLANNYNMLIVFTLAGLLLVLVDQGLGFLQEKNRIYLNSVITFTLLKDAFKHTLRMKMELLHNTNAAEIMATVQMDVENIARVSDSSTFYIFSSIFKMIGGLIGLLLLDWRLTLMVAVIVPLRYILVRYIAKKRKRIFEEYINLNRKFSAFYGDTYAGVKEIKLWGLERVKIGEFLKAQRGIISSKIKMVLIDKANLLSETLLFQLVVDLIYIVGAYLVFQKSLTVGELFAFITYSTYVTGPISAILNIGYNFVNIIPSAKRYFVFMDKEIEPQGKIKPDFKCENKKDGITIEYDGVSFSYNEEKKVLNKVSFVINEGEKVAIVGANGCGKSTIINLLLRLYRPTSGRILFSGVDIGEYNLREYRGMFSVVSQDMYLFNKSIKDNISLNARIDELHLHKTVKECGLSEFIEKFPDKYDTIVGANGTSLSGGERQKIAFARAIARDFKILILDEATANYDIGSEAEVNKYIGGLHGKTVVVVTHKPDILKYMDKIIVLDNGIIANVGKHDDLYRSSSIYKKMVESYGTFKNKAI